MGTVVPGTGTYGELVSVVGPSGWFGRIRDELYQSTLGRTFRPDNFRIIGYYSVTHVREGHFNSLLFTVNMIRVTGIGTVRQGTAFRRHRRVNKYFAGRRSFLSVNNTVGIISGFLRHPRACNSPFYRCRFRRILLCQVFNGLVINCRRRVYPHGSSPLGTSLAIGRTFVGPTWGGV